MAQSSSGDRVTVVSSHRDASPAVAREAERRRHDVSEYGRFIGRVGALAVALGIGVAVASSPGIAWAEPDSESSSSSGGGADNSDAEGADNSDAEGAGTTGGTDNDAESSPTSRPLRPPSHRAASASTQLPSTSGRGPTGSGESATSRDVSDDDISKEADVPQPHPKANRSPSTLDIIAGRDDEADAGSHPAGAEINEIAAEPDSTSSLARETRSAGRDISPAAVASTPVSRRDDRDDTEPPNSASEDRHVEAHASSIDTTAPAAAAANAASLTAATSESAETPFAPEPLAMTAQSPVRSQQELPPTFVREVIDGVASFLKPIVGPDAPVDNSLLWGVLAWVRREGNNHSPTITYSASQTVQVNGALFGKVVAADPDNDNLTLTVTKAPTDGTVALNQDGTFRYIPSAEAVVAGGPDSFEVTVSDRQRTANGLADVFGGIWGKKHTARVTVTLNVVPQTSPLVTPEQLDAEERAQAIFESGALDPGKAAIRASWLEYQQATVTGEGVVSGIDAENLARLDQAVDEYAMYASLLAVNWADSQAGKPSFVWFVTPSHTLDGQATEGTRILSDNPDTIYRIASVNSAASYEINGSVNGQMPTDVVFTVQLGLGGQQGETIGIDDLQIRPDGTFTITVSSEEMPGVPNHLYLPPDANVILSRNTLTDWNTQQALTLSIVQVSGPTREVTPAEVTTRAQQAVQIGPALGPFWFGLARQSPGVNQLTQPVNLGGPSLATQRQSAGIFNLSDDEALVITIYPGTAQFFNVPVGDIWTVSADYVNQPASLNNSQMIANPDGTYTIVVSPTDPGVANWVSTGGLNQGTIYARFQRLDPTSTDVPTTQTQVVTLDQLGTVLPATTVYVTPEQRAQQIAERQSGYTLRTAPYVSLDNLD